MKIFNKTLILTTILAFTVPCCFAIDENSSQPPLTLKDCIEKALYNSPLIKRAKINYEIY